jgi:hypothetical protein
MIFSDSRKRLAHGLSLIILLILFFTSCRKDDDNILPGKTLLVYMAADNSLSGDADANINNMISGFANYDGNGRVLIYLDGNGNNPQLFQLVKDNSGQVTRESIKEYPQQNSLSPEVMDNIFSDVVHCFPSQSYGLVLWSHGYGWIPQSLTKSAIRTRWFGQDGSNYMEIQDLINALSRGPRFSYILFDACFMGGIETAYALRRSTDYLIASPSEILSDGFPYQDILSSLLGNSESDYIRAGYLYFDHYNNQSGCFRSGTVACIRCREMDDLAIETRKLITSHVSDLNVFNPSSIQPMEGYSPHLFFDFRNFIEAFTTNEERSSFESALNRSVIFKASTPGIVSVRKDGSLKYFTVSNYCGLNVYVPQSENSLLNAAYHSTEWYKACGLNESNW